MNLPSRPSATIAVPGPYGPPGTTAHVRVRVGFVLFLGTFNVRRARFWARARWLVTAHVKPCCLPIGGRLPNQRAIHETRM